MILQFLDDNHIFPGICIQLTSMTTSFSSVKTTFSLYFSMILPIFHMTAPGFSEQAPIGWAPWPPARSRHWAPTSRRCAGGAPLSAPRRWWPRGWSRNSPGDTWDFSSYLRYVQISLGILIYIYIHKYDNNSNNNKKNISV